MQGAFKLAVDGLACFCALSSAQSLAHSPHEFDVVVTTYEMVKSPQLSSALGSRTWWRYLVIDEGH
eukprot:6201686-Pleurochrysis_carterae.AAC.1